MTSSALGLATVKRPALEVYPPFTRTLAVEALDLAEAIGMELDDWQADGMEIMLSLGDDGLWNCPTYCECVSRQNGKGVIGELRVLSGLYLFGEQGILWSSNRYKASKKAFDRTFAWIEANDFLSKRVKKVVRTHGEEGLILYGPDSRRLTGLQEFACVARSEQSGRSFTIDTNIIDEALAFTQDQAGGLFFAKSAVRNPQTIYLSSPPLKTDPEIVLFKVKQAALNAERTGVVSGIGFRDWGVRQLMDDAGKVDRTTGRPLLDVTDRALWDKTNPGRPRRISDKTILDEIENLSPVVVARERLGAWPAMPAGDVSDTVIPRRVWQAIEDPSSTPLAPMCMAIDLDPAGTGAAIVGYGLREDGLGHVEVVAARPGVEWVPHAAYVLNGLHSCWWVLDAQGPAKSLIHKLKLVGIEPPGDEAEPQYGNLLIMRASDVGEAWGSLRNGAGRLDGDQVKPGDWRHRGQPHLDSALGNAVTRNLGDAEALARRTSSGSITCLVGASSARWGFEHWVDQIRLPESDPGVWVL